MLRELVARKVASRVCGMLGDKAQAARDPPHRRRPRAPMPAPPSQTIGAAPVRPCAPPRRCSAAPMTSPVPGGSHRHGRARSMPPAATAGPGRAGRSMPNRSTVATRSTAVMPLSVANADTPSTSSTTQALRLPAPARTRFLLPQPDASTMPKPNSSPPDSSDSHSSRAAGVDAVAGA